MSRLEELIQGLCPDGVEFKPLGDIINILDSQRRPVTKKDRTTGLYPYYGANGIQDFVDDYLFDGVFLLVGEDGSVINPDHSPILTWVEGKVWVNNHAHVLSERKEFASLRFIFHYLQTIDISPIVRGMPPKINQEALRNISIPLPPLPVQEEIVRILDKFTALEAELEAELEARKKQYEYYRDDLLTFGDSVEWRPLGDMYPFIRNGFVGTVTPFFTHKELGVRYLQGTNIHNGVISDNEVFYVTNEFHQKHIRTELKSDDIIMVQSGHVGQSAVVGDTYKGANCHALIVMSNGGMCDSRFVNYYFQSSEGKKKLERITTGGTLKHILASKMKSFIIPVPKLEFQVEIADRLDRFDALVNDITQGLPAELAARRKQYEYYRDKLLTFKEKVS